MPTYKESARVLLKQISTITMLSGITIYAKSLLKTIKKLFSIMANLQIISN